MQISRLCKLAEPMELNQQIIRITSNKTLHLSMMQIDVYVNNKNPDANYKIIQHLDMISVPLAYRPS